MRDEPLNPVPLPIEVLVVLAGNVHHESSGLLLIAVRWWDAVEQLQRLEFPLPSE